ncbi:MAG: NADH-quinone oxidoreductase subunit L [Verrucomicrobiota bacterium]|jgi:NADH-quinone oxidoreductase subunit L
MHDYLPWFILLMPLCAAVLITLFGQKRAADSATLSVGAVSAAFIGAVILWADGLRNPGGPAQQFITSQSYFTWLRVDKLYVEFGVVVDPLSTLMLLVVTGVGGLIHIYSIGYMKGDRGFARFFALLSLFTFSMVGLVLSNNFLQMFIFWELVGVCSYLLIGFWYERPAAADAAKKAFLTNRVGDFGFLTGIIMIWAAAGSLSFSALETRFFVNPAMLGSLTTLGGLLIFCGAAGKSAQFPLHVWLPDAMEGPTPVSALIHAATMVAAGVYMLCRVFFVFNLPAQTVIMWIGGLTALLAALIAVQQNDIKRILAYSTVSQLGYMVMAAGLSTPAKDMFSNAIHHQPAAMYHLATHACFKALLFLGAGSAIHALSGEQDIWKMGRLKEKMPVTAFTFLIGTLALCGVLPLSGFYSKDAILAAAYERSPALFGVGVVVAFLTTFYMFRLVIVAFWGKAKSDLPDHAHESPKVMTTPLWVLAFACLVGGGLGIYQYVSRQYFIPEENLSVWALLAQPFHDAPKTVLCGLVAVFFGFVAAWGLYAEAASDPLPAKLPGLCRVLRRKFYFDELYAWIIAVTQDAMARLADRFDRKIIAGCVRLVHGGTELVGRELRLAQTGNLQTSALLFAAGAAAALYFMFRH